LEKGPQTKVSLKKRAQILPKRKEAPKRRILKPKDSERNPGSPFPLSETLERKVVKPFFKNVGQPPFPLRGRCPFPHPKEYRDKLLTIVFLKI